MVMKAIPQDSVLGTVLFNVFTSGPDEGIKCALSSLQMTPSWVGVDLLESREALLGDLGRLDQ